MKHVKNLKLEYNERIKNALQEKFAYKNINQIPKIEKVVLNRGCGEANSNSKIIDYTVEQMIAVTGQKPIVTKAKNSISNFKLRQGQAIGCKVTLRGDKMYEFITKLINIALPKIRDFRGINPNAFDGKGNYTLGIKEDYIFPEAKEFDKGRGFNISFVTTAQSNAEAYELLKLIGMPFRVKNNG